MWFDGLKPVLGASASLRTHLGAEPALQSRNTTGATGETP